MINMKNFLLINGSLFFIAILIFFRCKSAKIPRSAEILADLFQMLEKKPEKNPVQEIKNSLPPDGRLSGL